MIQSALLAILGFLSACLLFLFIAPAVWSRAVRLTTQKLRNSLPVSEAEVRASKDLIRAEYAVKVHQLGKTIEKSRLSAHRQTIEINRRDASITKLQADITRLNVDLSEHQNAHSVLKQTINDRLPKLEGGIEEARRLLEERDDEIRAMQESAGMQTQALDEARQFHSQQAGEIERLRQALATAQGQDRRRAMDLGVDTEYSLRSELDSVRHVARSQAKTIERLQMQLSGAPVPTDGEAEPALTAVAAGDEASLRTLVAEQAAEIRQMKRELGEAAEINKGDADSLTLLQQIRGLEAKTRDQSDEIRRLRDEVDRLEAAVTPETMKAVTESKSFLKSRLEKLESQSRGEREVTGRLRAELASANERAARQAVYFRDELRRLGTRSLTPVTSGSRTGRGSPVPMPAPANLSVVPPSAPEAPAQVDRRAIWAARFLPAPAPPRTVVRPRDAQAAPELATELVENDQAAITATAGTAPSIEPTAASQLEPQEAEAGVAMVAVNDPASATIAVEELLENTSDDTEQLTATGNSERRGRLLDRLRTYGDAS